jgi:hypothetical protein
MMTETTTDIMTETTEEIETIDLLDKLSNKKNDLLVQYKALKVPLEYAQNDFDKSLIEEKMAILAKDIKSLATHIEEIKEV